MELLIFEKFTDVGNNRPAASVHSHFERINQEANVHNFFRIVFDVKFERVLIISLITAAATVVSPLFFVFRRK